MINVSIESDHTIENFEVEDLFRNNITVNNNQNFDVASDWFLIKVPYCDVKNEIKKIKLNHVDIGYLMYTGWFENAKNEVFQPASAVWEDGFFKLWLHKNIGYYKWSLITQIANGDFGKNLFEKYMLTVDYSTELPDQYPDDVREFYKYPFGPRWWPKQDIIRPYKILTGKQFDTIDKKLLIAQAKKLTNFNGERLKEKNWKFWRYKEALDLPLLSLDNFNGQLKELFNLVGFESIIDFSILELDPKSTIHIHIDDHLQRECWPIIAGCKKFYWTLTDTDNAYFKLGEAGLVPLNYPLMMNTGMHTHSVVNDGNHTRIVLLVYGKINDNSSYKNLKIATNN